ncbi:MAG: acylase [Deltaproteobacteria bacterium]|nr:MAG: acylase [Deltaproteobacteria bacterium]
MHPSLRSLLALLALGLLAPTLPACSEDDDGGDPDWNRDVDTWQVTVVRDGDGIPHIRASDIGSLGFGQGYAFAQDHLCTLADQVLKVRSERARFHGPGPGNANIDSDFAWAHLGVLQDAEEGLALQPPEIRRLLRGYVAGFNHRLAELTPDQYPAVCRGAEWVRPITETELMAYYLALALVGSSGQLLPFIANAQPPGSTKGAAPTDLPPLPDFRNLGIGSNGWGLGAERTATGRGMVVGNPHFPWEGELRLWESHLTLDGVIDVYGASLLGVVGVLIGFNPHVAWTHTFSAADRFTFYRLPLVDDPFTYRYGDETRSITGTDYTIGVLQEDGSVEDLSRTLYRSHYGPILALDAPFQWTASTAISVRDANAGNVRLIEQWWRMNTATSLDEFVEAHRDVQGIPWVNTMAASAEGEAWYADASAAPLLSDATWARWLANRDGGENFTTLLWSFAGLILLQGDDPDDEWVVDPEARTPGNVPFHRVAQLRNDTYIFNANDSPWLTNVETPITGYPPIYGPEATRRSLRTRMNAVLLTETGPDAPSGTDGRFTLDGLTDMVFANRTLAAELWTDELILQCDSWDSVSVGDDVRDPLPLCDALRGWDRRANLDSRGALLFREWFTNLSPEARNRTLFEVPFDPEDPVHTPRGLAQPTNDPARTAMGTAWANLERAGIAPDAPLGDHQRTYRLDQSFPVHGAIDAEGPFHMIGWSTLNSTLLPRMARDAVVNGFSSLTTSGYVYNYGSSFILAVAYTDDGPDARTLLTYGLTDDESLDRAYADTGLFSNREWRTVRFTAGDLAADPNTETLSLSVPAD